MSDCNFTEASLVGARLIQVAVGEYQLQLHWDNGISMFCESTVKVTAPDSAQQLVRDGPSAAALLPCLGHQVKSVSIKIGDLIRVHLDHGVSIDFSKDSEDYENLRISSGATDLLIW